MSSEPNAGRIISPEQQLANLCSALDELRRSRRHRGRTSAIRAAERQVAEAEARHVRGELAPLVDDGAPF